MQQRRPCDDGPKKPIIYRMTYNNEKSILVTVRLLRGRRASLCPQRSNSRTLRLSKGTAITLDGETDTLLTGLSHLIEDMGERMLRKSHTLVVRSSEAEITLSSRVNVTQVTTLVCKKKDRQMF